MDMGTRKVKERAKKRKKKNDLKKNITKYYPFFNKTNQKDKRHEDSKEFCKTAIFR